MQISRTETADIPACSRLINTNISCPVYQRQRRQLPTIEIQSYRLHTTRKRA